MKLTQQEANKLGRLATERANAQADFLEVYICTDDAVARTAAEGYLSSAEDAFYEYLDSLIEDRHS